jgi:hypothetical protein
MADDETRGNNRVTRRDFLFSAAVGGGAIVAASALPSRAEASNKMSPRAMSYRPTPNGKQHCDNCANWQPPGSCKLVDGPISPTGWCILYRPNQ